MKVVFRVDASLQMGSGHVMRCLTLADALTTQGAQCHFISREHPGHLLEVVRQRGYMTNRLAAPYLPAQPAIKNIAASSQINSKEPTRALAHAAWLGCDWQIDAQQTGADYAFSVTSYAFPIQRAIRITETGRVDMFQPQHFNTRSQDLEEAFHDAGQFYWGQASAWLANKLIFGPSSAPVLLPRHRVQDIDTPEDWLRAEWLFKAMVNAQ